MLGVLQKPNGQKSTGHQRQVQPDDLCDRFCDGRSGYNCRVYGSGRRNHAGPYFHGDHVSAERPQTLERAVKS